MAKENTNPVEVKTEEMDGEETGEEAEEREKPNEGDNVETETGTIEKEKGNEGDNVETEMGTFSGIPTESGNLNLSESGAVTISCPSQSLQALSAVERQSQLEKLTALFAEIADVVGKTAMNPNEVEISKSVSLLKEVSTRPFSEISFKLQAELTSAVKVLVQAKTLPSGQASMIHIFFHQFEDICQSYDCSIAAFETTRWFFDSRDSTFQTLNRLSQSHLKIQNFINDIEKEKQQLERRLRELDESKF